MSNPTDRIQPNIQTFLSRLTGSDEPTEKPKTSEFQKLRKKLETRLRESTPTSMKAAANLFKKRGNSGKANLTDVGASISTEITTSIKNLAKLYNENKGDDSRLNYTLDNLTNIQADCAKIMEKLSGAKTDKTRIKAIGELVVQRVKIEDILTPHQEDVAYLNMGFSESIQYAMGSVARAIAQYVNGPEIVAEEGPEAEVRRTIDNYISAVKNIENDTVLAESIKALETFRDDLAEIFSETNNDALRTAFHGDELRDLLNNRLEKLINNFGSEKKDNTSRLASFSQASTSLLKALKRIGGDKKASTPNNPLQATDRNHALFKTKLLFTLELAKFNEILNSLPQTDKTDDQQAAFKHYQDILHNSSADSMSDINQGIGQMEIARQALTEENQKLENEFGITNYAFKAASAFFASVMATVSSLAARAV